MREDVLRFCLQTGASLEQAVKLAVAAESSGLIIAKIRIPKSETCDDCGESHLFAPSVDEVRYFARRTVDLTSREKALLN